MVNSWDFQTNYTQSSELKLFVIISRIRLFVMLIIAINVIWVGIKAYDTNWIYILQNKSIYHSIFIFATKLVSLIFYFSCLVFYVYQYVLKPIIITIMIGLEKILNKDPLMQMGGILIAIVVIIIFIKYFEVESIPGLFSQAYVMIFLLFSILLVIVSFYTIFLGEPISIIYYHHKLKKVEFILWLWLVVAIILQVNPYTANSQQKNSSITPSTTNYSSALTFDEIQTKFLFELAIFENK